MKFGLGIAKEEQTSTENGDYVQATSNHLIDMAGVEGCRSVSP